MTKQSIFVEYNYSSLQEAFECCWSSLADEHNTLPKSTRRNVKLNKFAFETQRLYQIYYVNIDLYHQYVTESHTFLLTKRCQWRGVRRNGCFRRLAGN